VGKRLDINEYIGKKYNRLTILRASKENAKSGVRVVASCVCGQDHKARLCDILSKKTRSCGCLQKESRIKHSMARSREYKSWGSMIQRCTNKNIKDYKYYGAKGIYVCEEWFNSFEQFYIDMGKRPNNTSLDRIDATKNYVQGNCRWSSHNVQMANRMSKSGLYPRGVKKTPSGSFQITLSKNNKRLYLGTFLCLPTAETVMINKYKELWGEYPPEYR
tara:strand:- start:690 stop:1343 length:654 start_codon:yes stop_codon:yes gene_type:complete